MIESFIGLFVIQLLSNCMSVLAIDGFWQKLIEGLLIVAIIAADCYSRKLKRRARVTVNQNRSELRRASERSIYYDIILELVRGARL